MYGVSGPELGSTGAGSGATSLPATTNAAIFNIAGTVKITQIVGVVTTVIQTQADLAYLYYNPTATGNNTTLCAQADITALTVGTCVGVTGYVKDPLLMGANPGALDGQQLPWILSDGAIHLDCSATNTGAIAWYVRYDPLSPGASVTVA